MDPIVNHNYIASELFPTHEIHLRRQVSGFGLKIHGGKEDGSQVWNKLSIHVQKEPGKYVQARTCSWACGYLYTIMSCTVSILLQVIYNVHDMYIVPLYGQVCTMYEPIHKSLTH